MLFYACGKVIETSRYESVSYTHLLETFNNVSSLVRDIFKKYNAIVFVGACGIAVRSIAPYVKDKAKDPEMCIRDSDYRGRRKFVERSKTAFDYCACDVVRS